MGSVLPRDVAENVSEADFRGFLEAAPDAVVIVNGSGQIVLVNAQTEHLFGYSRDELTGRRVDILGPEAHRDEHRQHWLRYFDDPTDRTGGAGFGLIGRRHDGSEFPIEISLSPSQTKAGTLILGAIRDISERMKAEEKRFALAAIVESSNDGIIGRTLGGVITSWNEGAHRILGYTSDEAIGKPISLMVPPNYNDEEAELIERLVRGERVEHFDSVRRRKDGVDIHVSVTVSLVRDSGGTLIGASKIVRDITDRNRGEADLARAKEAAEAASRALEAFSYSVAHDLRAPLRGMNGFAQMLLDTYHSQLDEDGRDWLQEIVLNARKMGLLIDSLLSLARLTKSELNHEWVDLSSVVRTAARQHATAEPERVVELIVQDDCGRPRRSVEI